MLVSMMRTLYPSTTRREVSFDRLVPGTRRGRGRALDTGAEEGVFPERKRRSSSRRFDYSNLTSSLSSSSSSHSSANSPSTSTSISSSTQGRPLLLRSSSSCSILSSSLYLRIRTARGRREALVSVVQRWEMRGRVRRYRGGRR